jgi:AcrR family transcriptional regulator
MQEIKEGRREQKREETLERIATTGLKLFIANGYEATTLEAIAEAAGISRRTFFNYFKSKEEVLMAWQGKGYVQAVGPTMLEESPNQKPIDAVRHCLLKLVSRYETEESIVVDQLLRSTEALRRCKEATFAQMEETLFSALCELWPQSNKRGALRTVAMMSMGVMRLALEAWRQEGGKRSLAKCVKDGFDTLKTVLP